MATVMDRGIDLNLNCSPCSSDVSLKEEIRQAILHHEIVFREQVNLFSFFFSIRELLPIYFYFQFIMNANLLNILQISG